MSFYASEPSNNPQANNVAWNRRPTREETVGLIATASSRGNLNVTPQPTWFGLTDLGSVLGLSIRVSEDLF